MDSLIKIEGKPLEKLMDVVSNAIGGICKPRQIVRVAKAEAKAESIKAIEQAKTNAIIDGDIEKAQYLDTINERLVKKETKRQKNIENIVAVAENILQVEDTVSEEPVNPDWTTRFFDITQDVSDEEMQHLWGQILAGEIKLPKSYSLRTLEILRNMTKDEAEIFQKVAQYALLHVDGFLYSPDNVLDKLGVPYSSIAKLVEIGLLQSGDFVTRNYSSNKTSDNIYGIIYGNLVILVKQKANAPKISFNVRLFTTPGNELLKLVNIKPNMEYLQEFAKTIKNGDVLVSYAEFISSEADGTIRYKKPIINL